jgi:Tol biopolymer transport system component
MKYLKMILFIVILVGCTPEQEIETPTADSATIAATSVAQPMNTIAVPTETIEATQTLEVTATDTVVPILTTPNAEATATATILPTTTPTQTVPFTEGQILFFWDTETPLEEPYYYSIPVSAPKQDLYVAIPGTTPSDWRVEPLLHDVLDWPNQAPSWPLIALSPDKTRLAFIVGNDTNDDGWEDQNSIFLYDLGRNTVEQVIDDTHLEIFGLTWWPDNQTLAYSWGKEVFLVEAGDSLVQPLTSPFSDDVSQIAGSPDGNLLAIELQGSSVYNLLFFNRNTSQLSQPISSIDLRGSHNSVWSGNSSWIAANRLIDTGLELVNANTYEKITLVDVGFTSFAWSPDGSQLAFTQNTESQSWLSVWDSATSTRIQLVEYERAGFSPPVWSPDGIQIATSIIQDSTASLSAVELATGASRELLQMEDIYGFEPISWSPDGQWILFFASQESHSGLYIIDETGGEPHLILETTGTLNPYQGMWLAATPDTP